MSKNLIISCSPRKNGNSDIMAQIALDTLKQAGHQGEIIYLRDVAFSPCIACSGCFKNGECVIKDDLQTIYPQLLEAENIILSAPIYFQSLGALAKAFIDRMQRFWAIKYILKRNVIKNADFRAKRHTYALLCGGTNFSDTFTCAEKTAKLFGLILEAKYAGGTFFPLIEEKGDILKEETNPKRIRKDLIETLNL